MPKNDPARAALLRCSPVKIGADYFHLKVVPTHSWKDGNDCVGVISFQDREIRFRDTIRGCHLVDVIFHECLHGVWTNHLFGILDQWPPTTKTHGKLLLARIEEVAIRAYQSGLPALFLDNPKLLKLFNHYWQPTTRKRKD